VGVSRERQNPDKYDNTAFGLRAMFFVMCMATIVLVFIVWRVREPIRVLSPAVIVTIYGYFFIILMSILNTKGRVRIPLTIGCTLVIYFSSSIILFAKLYTFGCVDSGKLDSYFNVMPVRLSSAESIYFSVISWTTLGYGDYSPLGSLKWVAASEAVLGYLFISVVIAVVFYELRQSAYISPFLFNSEINTEPNVADGLVFDRIQKLKRIRRMFNK